LEEHGDAALAVPCLDAIDLLLERKRPLAVRPDRVRPSRDAVREPQTPAVELDDLGSAPELVGDGLYLVSPKSRRAHGGIAPASRARPPRPRSARSRRSARSQASPRRVRSPSAGVRVPLRRFRSPSAAR